jgi:hypothetical protein
MSCVNTNSKEYKDLVKGMNPREEFAARAVLTRFLTVNNTDKLPDYIELKSMMSDMYNTNKGGIDYQDFYGEVRSMFKSLIPSITDEQLEQRVKFVDKLELMRLRDGLPVLSTFINNTVYIANSLKSDRGTQAYKDVRHEVFHMIFNNFLSEREQENLFGSFKRQFPEFATIKDKVQLEEAMAEKFEDYRNTGKPSLYVAIKEFFQDLLRFFGMIGESYNDIQRLFQDVEGGKFTRNYLKDSLVTRDKTVLFKYPEFSTDLDHFLQVKAFLLNNLNELMFPSNSKTLSETNNRDLFLDENYRSNLFKNNKEVFKLGLTKNDALVELQARIKNLKRSTIQDENLKRVINTLSKRHILKDMYDYLQPYSVAEITPEGELRIKGQIEEDETANLLEQQEGESTPDLQIGSKELINPTTKISEVVKDFLANITYETTPGNFVNIDPGVGFISLINMLTGLYGNTSIEDNLKTLQANKTFAKGTQSKAVYNKLTELHQDVLGYNRMSLNITDVPTEELNRFRTKLDESGIKYEVVKNKLNIVIPANIQMNNRGTNSVDNVVEFTFNRLSEGKKSFRLEQEKGESNKTFIQRVADETGIPSIVVAKVFNYNEQRNQLAELTKVAGSLRKLSPKFVRVSTKREFDEDAGEAFESTSFAFINKVNEYKSSSSLSSTVRDRLDIPSVRKEVLKNVDKYSEIKKKNNKAEIRELLRQIVVGNLDAISNADFMQMRDQDITYIWNNLESIVNNVADIRTNKPATEFKDSDVYLRKTSDLSNKLTSYTFEKNAPTSFQVSTSNKSKWENVMPNTSWKIFKNLEDFALGVVDKLNLLPYLRESFGNYLKYNPILIHNYSNGTFEVNTNNLKVGDADFYADHQETYFENANSNFEKRPISFDKESSRDWINRNFLAMFQIPILEAVTRSNTERAGLSYFQQKFQPESAPNVSIVKMGILSANELQENLMHMVIQEAHMNHLFGASDRKNLRNNTKKSMLPGLEGSSYFIKDGQNVFFDEAGNLRPEFGSVVNNKLQINKNNKQLNELVSIMMGNLDQTLSEFVDLAITEKASLDGYTISEMYEKIKNSYPKEYQLSVEELSALRSFSVDPGSDVQSLRAAETFTKQREALKKAMSAYYLNSYVNGYFMNQLSSGATQNYKNVLDEVKRQAGVNAMNDTGLIDNQHGMRTTYRNVVIAPANNFYGLSNKLGKIKLLERFFKNKKQEVGDAQSWDLPEYKEDLRKSFGKSVDMGIITKDVHFEINAKGGVDYRKTSSAELTNEVVKKNKTLRDLRFAMTFEPYLKTLSEQERPAKEARIRELYNKYVDQNDLKDVNEYFEYKNLINEIKSKGLLIDKASFDSAIKGSKPSTMSSFTLDKETGTYKFNFEPASVLELNSAYNGIQQAVRHRYIDSFISHFTQLTYLIGLNRTPTSIKNNKVITKTLSKFAKAGIYDTLFDYRMRYDEGQLKANARSKSAFIQDLKKKLNLPGNERLMSFLETKNITMNNPLFSEKLMQNFFNSLTKRTVTPKHPGGSFVLQSEFGFEANKVLAENSLRTPELKVDDKGNILYAECYLPEMYSDQLKTNDLIYYNSDDYSKMFGFRIPSSDLHSSVPLKVIGYYPSSSHDNVVVIPSAVTALHGSDFDVDKLFVVRHGVYGVKNEEQDPKNPDKEQAEPSQKREYKTKFQTNNIVIGQKGIKIGYISKDAKYDDRGNITDVGNHTQIFNFENVLLDEKQSTKERILELEDQLQAYDSETKGLGLLSAKQQSERRAGRGDLKRQIDAMDKHLDEIKTIQKGFYSNTMLDAVLDNISYSGENAEDLLYGITFDPVKGYDENSEYSQLARVYSDINKANGSKDIVPERPTLFKTLEEAITQKPDLYTAVNDELTQKLGVDTTTEDGKKDLLAMINGEIEDQWVGERDRFIARQRKVGSVNINRAEQHVRIHKETYMAAGLVGLIANFSKGLSYLFHGINDDSTQINLEIGDENKIVLDGQTFNSLSLANKDGVKTQELRSLALNAAIDHVKEQILNVLNVGDNTAKIFLAAISTEMNMHQASMIMLQPVTKELNSSDAGRVSSTVNAMQAKIKTALGEGKYPTDEELAGIKLNTKELEKNITTSFEEVLNKGDRKQLLQQLKMLQVVNTLNNIGQGVSDVSAALSVIQGLPYNLETAYDKLTQLDNFINVENFYNKLAYQEKSEYGQPGFKDDLKTKANLFSNVNLANNENVLGALEAIKAQIDIVSEIFSENSLQAQFVIQNLLKAISNNSDPQTLLTGENDQDLSFDTTKQMTVKEKYLKGVNTFNMVKVIARNLFNYVTSGLNVAYNKQGHIFSFNVHDQNLKTVVTNEKQFELNAVKSYLESFLMKEGDAKDDKKRYNGDDYITSQINPLWRVKPLTVIKNENPNNRFLRGIGVDTNFRDKVRVMTFNSSLMNTAENIAEMELAADALNGLNNIYVRWNEKQEKWENVPASLHPETNEMNEVMFNIIKSSLYTDKFKFSSNKVTAAIPTKYFAKLFRELETLTKDLILWQVNDEGNKYYKDFSDLDRKTQSVSALSQIKENIFINTIFSIPNVLPNVRNKYNFDNKEAGILPNGNVYDFFIDASKLDETMKAEAEAKTLSAQAENTEENTNQEVDQELSEVQAEGDLYNKFKRNPSFLVDESRDRPGYYEVFMKVGSTGSKDSNDLKYFYKKIGNVNGKITNNSFDISLLLNNYKIKDYFNPTRVGIPVKVDFSGNKVSLKGVKVSSFLITKADSEATKKSNKAAYDKAFNEQYEYLKSLPENKNLTEAALKRKVKVRTSVESVVNQINEVSLYDSRRIDRIGLKNFKIVGRTLSADKSTIDLELEALPNSQQPNFKRYDTPLVLTRTINADNLSRVEKEEFIKGVPGAKPVLSNENLTDAELNNRYNEALDIADQIKEEEIKRAIQKKQKNCK